MKRSLLSFACLASIFAGVVGNGFGQTVTLSATINAAQETTGSTSTATGSAVMIYNVATNTFDLAVVITGMTNTITASHFHESTAGVAGPIVNPLGADSVYTRSGTTVTGNFRGQAYTGNPLTLLKNGAYINFHSAAWPGGEIRGQMTAQSVRLYANISAAQEVPANGSPAFGAALIDYDSGLNRASVHVNLYNFVNDLTASHFHEGARGVSGPVVTNLGGTTAYGRIGNFLTADFAVPYTGDPIKLLTGGAYVNFHSTAFGGGEIRGQVIASSGAIPTAALVGPDRESFASIGAKTASNVVTLSGNEPARLLITGQFYPLPSSMRNTDAANPQIALLDASGNVLSANDDLTKAYNFPAIAATGRSFMDKDGALLLILPPGNYTTQAFTPTGSAGQLITEAVVVP